ncbi:putative elongator complex protein 1 [Leptopilina heterotoma]|uniref:putative elongator complex protein 1 n=1 Tax=Leptopilina heterotoma TaxID=63436 RepID=UPI001CA7DA1E|nr:putative elongator complex protein 1 [Leptopilina heterotoma]XP_043471429.1 putative elongator complex protein 1 [Leptopilina heterotoma]XP_043471430.1 putative elongator complex protein 1 [Leptopilina heterotoma]
MKNLTLYNQEIREISKRGLSTDVNHYCLDPDNDDFYIETENNFYQIPSDSEKTEHAVNSDHCCQIIGMFTFLNRIYYASDNGNLFCFDILDPENFIFYEELNVDLHCMSISPDMDIIVVVTKTGQIVTLDLSLEVLSKVDLFSSDFGEKQFVTVGWGKKETQFHGTEGKAAAKIKQTVFRKTETDDGKPRVTWNGDGAMFAVSFINNESEARQFKVYNRENVLQYTSELLDGLEENISWKPMGNLIATTQKQPNKHVVALFEKNGLKHREFALPSNLKLKVKDLLWSDDSEILAIWCKNLETEETIVQLWTEGNYHWYLKQSLKFNKDTPVLYVKWSSASKSGNKLIVLTEMNLISYTFHWTVNYSRGQDSTDKAIVAVIDGEKVLMTSFKDGIVPPPMCQESLEMNGMINYILFAPQEATTKSSINSNALICISDNYRMSIYVDSNESYLKYKLLKTYDLELENGILDKNIPMNLHHFLWFEEDRILCSVNNSICVIRLEDLNNTESNKFSVQKVKDFDGAIQHIVPSPKKNSAYIIAGGTVFRYINDEFIPIGINLPDACKKVEIIEIEKKDVIISLSLRQRLFIDGKEVCNNVTSFYVHSDFLLLTTLQHSLICFPLSKKGIGQIAVNDLTLKPWENGNNEILHSELSIRRVERGSILVRAIPKEAQTILQMPRGNLECIQPRALSLHIIGTYIDNQNYKSAFDLMRKQRINLNLLYDHNPNLFTENAKLFVDNIDNPSWLSLFLSELKEEDVTQTTYASSYQNKKLENSSEEKGEIDLKLKLNKICDILRNIMEERQDSNRFVQPILISLVKKQQTIAFEDALKKLKEIKNSELETNNAERVSSEEALKYLLYLVDVNVLFDTALGMYDFELTMFIAQKSQKDPKEYIPFLNHLKNLEENYMKFNIDKHLKRYTKALEHIVKLNEKFDECFEFIKKHDLYMKALNLFNSRSNEYREIAKAYGEFFLSKAKYREAAVMFHKAECLKEALNAHKLAGNYQEIIITVVKMNLSVPEAYEIYEDLVNQLRENKKYKEAAEVLMQHLNKSEDAVAVLCEGKVWRDAWKETYCMKRMDLIETHVKPGVHEHAKDLIAYIERTKEEFCKYRTRLAFIRTDEYKKQMQMKNEIRFDNEPDAAQGFSDLISETSSIAGSTVTKTSQSSRSSGRTYKSSKNRRKHERKLLNLKEGSVFEDLALLRTLHEIIVRIYAQKGEVSLVAEMLLNFNNEKLGEELNNAYCLFINLIERSKYEIWNKKDIDERLSMASDNIENLQNPMPKNLIEPKIFYPPEIKSSSLGLDMFASKKIETT